MKTRTPLAILAATAIAGLGFTALATPASAEPSVQINGKFNAEPSVSEPSVEGLTVTVTVVDDFGSLVRPRSPFLSTLDEEECTPTVPGNQDTNPCIVNPTESVTFSIVPGANSETVELINGNGEIIDASFTVTYSDGSSPAPAAPAAAPAPAPATVNVTLDQITSKVLRAWASTATLGSWQQLPESSDITGVDENAGKTFLGAATTPNFPVDIAQRQVDNGWGPYETFNEDGDLTSVFIPAGKPMNINGPTRLYAIWGN